MNALLAAITFARGLRLPCIMVAMATSQVIHAQPYGQPDRGEPEDAVIQDYLRWDTEQIESNWSVETLEQWNNERPRWRREYYHMLGLWPEPEKTPLQATVTGRIEGGDYTVEKLHYQSRPGLYVTANLYRPANVPDGKRLPGILYVCGHSSRGRNGNKTAFQSHGIWFARHGYVCLVVDTLQLGEIAGIHHGTYRENRWWWLSRGYTPAGVECWNGVRGLDYLVSRPEVDPERLGVTGISGGGAATFWVAAADERAKVAIPVSGMADLLSYIPDRVINGHCDCMFLYNTYRWPWARIAALVAPRPMLFVNSDKDPIFPMDANDRVINRLERVYSLFGASDHVDAFVSMGGHDYREDIRKGVYRFMNIHLKGEARPVEDSEVDLVRGPRESVHPIPPEELRVFPSDADVPADAMNGKVDEHFVPMAKVSPPEHGQFEPWRERLLRAWREASFSYFPARVPAAEPASGDPVRKLVTERGITNRVQWAQGRAGAKRVILCLSGGEERLPDWLKSRTEEGDAIFICQTRGFDETRWTRKNPPNYVERAHYLLGRTVDVGRIWDVLALARYFRAANEGAAVWLAGETNLAAIAVFAAALDHDIAGMILRDLPASLMDANSPAVLNALRVGDLGDALGCVAPRPVTLVGAQRERFRKAARVYEVAGEPARLVFQ